MNRNATVVATSIDHGRPLAPGRGSFCLLFTLALLFVAPRAGAADRPTEGLLVQVGSITSESTGRLRSLAHGPLKRFEQGAARQRGRFWLVLDFNPDGQPAESDDFGACLNLARYLRALPTQVSGVSTVAYVRGDVRRHSVLAVLACSRVELSAKGRVGQVTDGARALDRVERAAYDDFTRDRYDPLLIRRMYDANLRVWRSGKQFVDRPPAGQFDDQPLLGGDQTTALYDLKLIRDKELGLFASAPINSTDELRATYNLPRAGVQRHLDRTTAWRIPLEGAITGELVELTKRRVKRALQARANLLVFELRCAGGDAEAANELGMYIAGLNDGREESPVETVAFVTNQARNLAAFVAFSCNKMVMQYRPAAEGTPDDEEGVPTGEARLGQFGHFLKNNPTLEDALRENLTALATRQGYSAALIAGMFSRDLRVYLVERTRGESGRMFLTDDELRAERERALREEPDKKPLWAEVFPIKPWKGNAQREGAYLTLSAREAREIGIADVVKDFDELCEREGVVPSQVHSPGADWLDGLGDFLRHPWTSVLLVMIGITCLILELKMPGVGLPGVIAAICFVLFFWAHSQLHGQITWLALLLFILGLVLIGLEVFVLPGFGVCGICGTLLTLASLGLVAYGHWPRTGPEWASFGQKLTPFGVSLLGAVALVALTVRYLPHIPILNRLMSKPADAAEEGEPPPEPSVNAELEALLGAIGVAATPLRPAGKCQFQDAFVDVQSDGGFIPTGTRVKVVEIEGNRVKVKQV